MLDETGIEYCYHHFETDEAVAPPFLVYLTPSVRGIFADGIMYGGIKRLIIELYTDDNGVNQQGCIEKVLSEHKFTYTKEEMWIESENLYETIYEMEVLING